MFSLFMSNYIKFTLRYVLHMFLVFTGKNTACLVWHKHAFSFLSGNIKLLGNEKHSKFKAHHWNSLHTVTRIHQILDLI